MPKLTINFSGGVQRPAKLGTVILKPTTKNKLAYAQNIQSGALEYGEGLVVPGPAVVTLANNGEVTGVPIAYAKSRTGDAILFIEGVIGNFNRARSINQVTNGQTPQLEAGINETVAHSGHGNVALRDLTIRDDDVYLLGKDDTDGWVQKDTYTGGGISFSAIQTLTGYINNVSKIFKANANEDNIYVAHGRLIDEIANDGSDTYSAAAFTLPTSYIITEMEEWNDMLVIAYHVGKNTGIVNRRGKGRSGIRLWRFINTTIPEKDIPCSATYISAMARRPDGNLIVFGSQREGMTTLYLFTGFGFNELYSYIGEPPISRHAVDFDNQGNVLWQTLNGEICKYNFTENKFEHITSNIAASGLGGIFTSLLGGTGNEWLAGAANDDSATVFQIARITHGNYIGDGDAAADAFNTPLAISGQEFLPPDSTITAITLYSSKKLATNEKVILRIYENGDTTPSDYLTMEFSADGAISSKRQVLSITGVNNFSLGIVYKQSDNLATALPIFTALLEYESTIK